MIIDVLDNLKEKYSMDDSNIAMAAINLVIGNKSFFVNEDDSWIHKQNNTDRNRSNRNINNRMRNSNREIIIKMILLKPTNLTLVNLMGLESQILYPQSVIQLI